MLRTLCSDIEALNDPLPKSGLHLLKRKRTIQRGKSQIFVTHIKKGKIIN